MGLVGVGVGTCLLIVVTDGQKHRLGSEDVRLKDEIIEQEERLKPRYREDVVVRRAKPRRAEDNVGVGCSTGSGCHSSFDH
jgi:hypothetical protein